jgi:hypothetical protein
LVALALASPLVLVPRVSQQFGGGVTFAYKTTTLIEFGGYGPSEEVHDSLIAKTKARQKAGIRIAFLFVVQPDGCSEVVR